MGGHLEALKWIKSKGYPIDWSEAFSGAAEGGHLEILKWLRSEGYRWNEDTCSSAAKGGHLDVLKYLHENGCPWDNLLFQHTSWGQACFQYAMNNGCNEIEPNYGYDSDEDDM